MRARGSAGIPFQSALYQPSPPRCTLGPQIGYTSPHTGLQAMPNIGWHSTLVGTHILEAAHTLSSGTQDERDDVIHHTPLERECPGHVSVLVPSLRRRWRWGHLSRRGQW